MINIVFLLLLFFMLAGSVEPKDIVTVAPPVSTSGEREDNGLAEILMDGEGSLYLREVAVGIAELREAIAGQLTDNPETRIRFKVDGGAATVQVIRVLEQLRLAGAEELVLLTLETGQ
jgi:biopolymer transport protein ExbD